jgi:hypothetical protein
MCSAYSIEDVLSAHRALRRIVVYLGSAGRTGFGRRLVIVAELVQIAVERSFVGQIVIVPFVHTNLLRLDTNIVANAPRSNPTRDVWALAGPEKIVMIGKKRVF